MIRFGKEVAEILKRRPDKGPLFPYLRTVRPGDRATEFKQRCEGLGIKGVSLHSYRYAWAERALKCGYPERFTEVPAQRGFSIIATANTRDRGVNDMSAALKRRFNIVVLPAPADLDTEVSIVTKRVGELASNLQLPAAASGDHGASVVITETGRLVGAA